MASVVNLQEWFQSKSLEDLCEDTTINQIVSFPQDVITLPSNTTVSQAIEILSSHRILSAPLEAPQDQQRSKKRYLGFVDMFDLVAYALKMCTEDRGSSSVKLHVWCQDIHKLTVQGEDFAKHQVKDIIDFSHYDPFCTISLKARLPQLLFIFQKGLHRVAVLDDQQTAGGSPKIRNIISQSTIIKWLAKNINHLGKAGQVPIDDLNLGQRTRIISITPESRAIHGFYQMLQRHVSAIAVVDKQGILVANLSVSDLKGLRQENFSDLLLPVLDYIRVHVTDKIVPPLTVQSSTTFETVILKLAATGAHRLWVVDENGRPTGVISLTDVMKLLDLRCYVKETDQPVEA